MLNNAYVDPLTVFIRKQQNKLACLHKQVACIVRILDFKIPIATQALISKIIVAQQITLILNIKIVLNDCLFTCFLHNNTLLRTATEHPYKNWKKFFCHKKRWNTESIGFLSSYMKNDENAKSPWKRLKTRKIVKIICVIDFWVWKLIFFAFKTSEFAHFWAQYWNLQNIY